MKRFRNVIIATLLIGGCFTIETVSRGRVNPSGRASTLSEYLTWRSAASQFAAIEINGKEHVIAYGPWSSWLLLSSGPSAYVFDETGRLVDWSADIGDVSRFDDRWYAQRARENGRPMSRVEVEQFTATRSGQANSGHPGQSLWVTLRN